MARYGWQRQTCLGEQTTTIMEPPPHHLTNNPNHNTYIRLIQSWLSHAHIGEYYKDFNIREDPSCPCGETYQTHIHIITECLLPNDEHNIIPTDLFGIKKGIAWYTKFLTKTNTFTQKTQDQPAPMYYIKLCYAHTHTPNLTPHICSTTLHHLTSLWIMNAKHPLNTLN
jgi:hypothetical protein